MGICVTTNSLLPETTSTITPLPTTTITVDPGLCNDMNLNGSKHLRNSDIPIKVTLTSKDAEDEISGSAVWVKFSNILGGQPAEMFTFSTTGTDLIKVSESTSVIEAVGVIESNKFGTLPSMSNVSIEYEVYYKLPISENRPKTVQRLGEKGTFVSTVII